MGDLLRLTELGTEQDCSLAALHLEDENQSKTFILIFFGWALPCAPHSSEGGARCLSPAGCTYTLLTQ